MDMKSVRQGYADLLASLEKEGITLDESQKQAFDGFMTAIEAKYDEVRDEAIKETRKIVSEKMNRKFKAAFEKYSQTLSEGQTLVSMIQEKVDEIKLKKALHESENKADAFAGLGSKPFVDTENGPIYAEYHPETNEIWYGTASNSGLIPDGKMKCDADSAYEDLEKLYELIATNNQILGEKEPEQNPEPSPEQVPGGDEEPKDMDALLENVDQFLDSYVEEVLPKKSIVDYDRLRKAERHVKTLEESLESMKKKVLESEKEKGLLESKMQEIEEKAAKANARALLESKLEDVPAFEAKEMRKRFDGCGEEEIKETFDKVLKEIHDGMETQKPVEDNGPLNLEAEISNIIEPEAKGTPEGGEGNPSSTPENVEQSEAVPDPEGIDEEEVYETEVDLFESSGEHDKIDQRTMDYFITQLENSYRYAR